MAQVQDFPILTESRRVPAQVLQFLESVNSAVGRQSRISRRASVALDEMTMRTLPELIEGALGPDHPELAKALHRLAVHYHAANNIEKAEFLYRRALDVASRAFPEPELEYALMMNNLGRLLHERDKLIEAEESYRKGIEMIQRALGPDHPKLATPLSNLAKLYMDEGKADLAEPLYQNSIGVLISTYGVNHPKVLRARARFAKQRKH
jgi:tetratricopeptide (TPR) repeat protein